MSAFMVEHDFNAYERLIVSRMHEKDATVSCIIKLRRRFYAVVKGYGGIP